MPSPPKKYNPTHPFRRFRRITIGEAFLSEQPSPVMTRSSDGDLLDRVRSGDAESLEALYDRYSRYVHGLALRMLGTREEADEVTQDVFWLLWKGRIRYDPDRGRFSTWLFAITRNRCIDRLRAERRRPLTRPLEIDSDSALEKSPEEDAYVDERRRIVLEALKRLPPEQQRAVELCFFQGMTHREVASHLGEPLGTIKSRIRMGMAKLKQSLLAPESI